MTLGPGVTISYSLDGGELWRMNRMGGYAIPSPFAWNDFLFVTSGAGGTYLPTPVIYKNALYVLNDKGIFSRRNLETGERIYQSRVAPGAAAFTASPWAHNGHVFVMSEEGDTFVIEAS